MPEENACYVLATIEGPFGTVTQVSGRMRVSEAAATCATFMPFDQATVRLTDMRIVRLAEPGE